MQLPHGQPSPPARAFGTDVADLAERIDPASPAEAVDHVLSACLGLRPETVRDWSVGRRLDALVAVRQAEGRPAETLPLRCPACEQPFEIEIDLQACREPVSEEAVSVELGTQRLRLRLPTGADQARWQRERTPLYLVAGSLLESMPEPAPAPDALVDALDRALAGRDPLRELALPAACPECGAASEHPIDLEAHLLACFARQQRTLLAEIAELAAVYHWAEADIAALPAWRREFYLQKARAR